MLKSSGNTHNLCPELNEEQPPPGAGTKSLNIPKDSAGAENPKNEPLKKRCFTPGSMPSAAEKKKNEITAGFGMSGLMPLSEITDLITAKPSINFPSPR